MRRICYFSIMSANNIALRPGLVLLSEPFMADPHFKRTVVLICEHQAADGTVGFVLNRPLGMKVQDTLLDMDAIESDLYYGGPVAQDTMHYLHRYGAIIEDSMPIMEGVYWGGNYEQLTTLLSTGQLNPAGIRFFLGYSGWSAGQLEDELAENSWLTTDGKSSYIFELSDNELWKRALEDKGGKYRQIIHYPEDPHLN